MKNPHPHVKWREGRPRFEPGPALRVRGYKATDLRWPEDAPEAWKVTSLKPGVKNSGRWFSKGEAVDWSDAFVRSLEKAAKGRRKAKAARPAERIYTLGRLFEDWYGSRKFQIPADPAEAMRQRHAGNVYSPKTVKDYRQKAGVIEQYDPSLWASPVDALTQPILFGLYEELVTEYGIATARGAIAVLSIALGWGRKRGKFTFRANHGANPAKDLDMATPPPRIRVGTRAEISTLIAVADHVGRLEIGDAIVLGLWTGQRQGDRLALQDKGLLNGRRIFRQAKTGALVAIMEAPEWRARLAAAIERRRSAKAEQLLKASAPEERRAVELRFSFVILDEARDTRPGRPPQRWLPFRGMHYSHVFAEIRALAVEGIPSRGPHGEPVEPWIIPPCPSLADFQERDLRDTAVTWMALAGATIPEIINVTGHSAESAVQILKHYLARDAGMADAAIMKMVAWYEAGGETEIGL